MSRIGNKVITLPAGVEVTNNDNVVTVKGPKGELTREFNKNIEIKVEGNEVTLHRPNDSKENKTIHGTSRANLNNMVVGVSEGYKKELELVGVGYRASNNGNIIDFALGYTHNIFMQLPPEIKVKLNLKEIRTLLLYWNLVTNSCSVRFVQKYALSVSLNLIKEKVLSLLVKKFVESLVSQLALNNSHKIVQL